MEPALKAPWRQRAKWFGGGCLVLLVVFINPPRTPVGGGWWIDMIRLVVTGVGGPPLTISRFRG